MESADLTGIQAAPTVQETEEERARRFMFCNTLDTRDELEAIARERARQDRQWGEQNHGDLYWFGILAEEMGEVAKALIEYRGNDVRTELEHVGAVAVGWLECIRRRERDS